jgi:hypothetical protein
VVNEVVEVELVDLAGIELAESGADVFEESPELLVVVCGDDLRKGSPFGLVVATPLSTTGRSSAQPARPRLTRCPSCGRFGVATGPAPPDLADPGGVP